MLWFQIRVFRTLFLYFAAAVLVLLLFFFSLLVLRFSEFVSEQSQSLGAVVELCLIGLPMHVGYVLPPAAGFAAFATFNRLQREGTWLGLIATGVTFAQILRVFLVFATVCSAVTLLFTLWLAPSAARAYYDRIFALQAERVLLAVRPTEFVTLGKRLTLWAESKRGATSMRNVFVLQQTSDGASMVLVSPLVEVFRRGRQGGVLLLHKGAFRHSVGTQEEDRFVEFETMELSLQELVRPERARQRIAGLATRLEVPTKVLLRDRNASERGQEYRRETMLRFSFPVISWAYVCLLAALFARVPLRRVRTWRKGLIASGLLTGYSLAHIYAVTLADRAGLAQGSVLYLWVATCSLALLYAYRVKR